MCEREWTGRFGGKLAKRRVFGSVNSDDRVGMESDDQDRVEDDRMQPVNYEQEKAGVQTVE